MFYLLVHMNGDGMCVEKEIPVKKIEFKTGP